MVHPDWTADQVAQEVATIFQETGMALAAHAEDAGDHNLPLMIWYAAEPAVGADLAKGAELLANCRIPKVQEFISRRIAAAATANTK